MGLCPYDTLMLDPRQCSQHPNIEGCNSNEVGDQSGNAIGIMEVPDLNLHDGEGTPFILLNLTPEGGTTITYHRIPVPTCVIAP